MDERTNDELADRLNWWLAYFNDDTSGPHPDFTDNIAGFDETALEPDLREAARRLREQGDDWREALAEVDLGGIYDEFKDAPDAIRQMGHYIKEAEAALEGDGYTNEGVSLAGRITALRGEQGERIEGQPHDWGIRRGEEYITLMVPFGSLPNPMPKSATLILNPKEPESE